MNSTDAKLSSVTNETSDNSAATLDDGVNAAKVAAMKAAELGKHFLMVIMFQQFVHSCLTFKTCFLLS